jgi:hypothetical protein
MKKWIKITKKTIKKEESEIKILTYELLAFTISYLMLTSILQTSLCGFLFSVSILIIDPTYYSSMNRCLRDSLFPKPSQIILHKLLSERNTYTGSTHTCPCSILLPSWKGLCQAPWWCISEHTRRNKHVGPNYIIYYGVCSYCQTSCPGVR